MKPWTAAQWERVFRFLEGGEEQGWREAFSLLVDSPELPLGTRLRLLEYLASAEGGVEEARLVPYRSAHALCTRALTLLEEEASPEALQPLLSELLSLPVPLGEAVLRTLASQLPAKAFPLYEALLETQHVPLLTFLADLLRKHPSPRTAQFLQRLVQQSAHKEVQKAARRALHALRSAGITVEPVSPPSPVKPVLEKPRFSIQSARTSPIDGMGSRAIWLARSKPFGGYNVVHLIINDRTGITDCMGAPVSKKEFPVLLQELQNDAFPLVEIDPAYCQHLIAEAHQRNLSSGTEVPREYFQLREIIGEPERSFPQPIIYQELDAEEIAAQPHHLFHSADLLNEKEFQSWYLPPEVIEKHLPRLQDMEESPIIVSPATQQEREEDALKAILEEFFDVETTRLYQRRLEEMAYLLLRLGKEEEARKAFAAALAISEKVGKDLFEIPFFRKMVERSFFKEERPEEEDRGNLIVPAWR
ncbi:MAG: hypothetical protein D6736_01385 [Nitrospinota bacterium]|nr:MAG: hypothetical protein D6736_01385 [Nitrospinota bacterium]